MAASVNDNLDQTTSSATGRPVTATLSAPGHSIGGTSIGVSVATNWSTTTGIHFSIYATTTVGSLTVKDTSTQTDWKGTLSGTTISNMTITGGTDQDYSAGAIVEITPTARWAKDLYDWAIAQHKQDGTHANTITTDTINENTAANGVTIDGMQIKDNLVVGASGKGVDNTSLNTAAGKLGAAWVSFAPTLSGRFTDAKWDKTCKYMQIGKTVHARYLLKANTTTPMAGGTTDAIVTLPVTSVDYVPGEVSYAIGSASLLDFGTTNFFAVPYWATTTTMKVRIIGTASTYASNTDITSTAPFTWTTSDEVLVSITYEAA